MTRFVTEEENESPGSNREGDIDVGTRILRLSSFLGCAGNGSCGMGLGTFGPLRVLRKVRVELGVGDKSRKGCQRSICGSYGRYDCYSEHV